MKKFLVEPVRNVKPIIDDVIKEAYELSWAYPRMGYFRDNKVTIAFKENDLRRLPAFKSLKEKHILDVKYPGTIIAVNAATPIQLQKNIIFNLCNLSIPQYNGMVSNSSRTKIEYNFIKHGEVDFTPIKDIFNVSTDADYISIAADSNIFSTQEMFII